MNERANAELRAAELQAAELQRSMARLAEGDRSAFEPVFAALWPACNAFARKLLKNAADAEDAAQKALLTLLSRAADFDPARSARAWALTLTAWECRTIVRKRSRGREVPFDVSLLEEDGGRPAEDASPEERAIHADLSASVEDALAGLSAEDRQTLALVLSGTPPGDAAFRKRKQRAVERLRALWRSNHA